MKAEDYDRLYHDERRAILMDPQCDPLDFLPDESHPKFREELAQCSITPSQIAHWDYSDLPMPYQRAVTNYRPAST